MENICSCGFCENIHHGLKHSSDLLLRSKDIAERINSSHLVDWKVMAAAALIHDIFAAESESHGQFAADFVDNNFCDEMIFSKQQVEKIKQAVDLHDKKISSVEQCRQGLNLETKILYDADNLDAFGIKGIYRYFCAHIVRGVSSGKPAQEILDKIKARVSDNVQKRRDNLYFEQARFMADNEFSVTKMFFDKLSEENHGLSSYKGASGVFTFIHDNFNKTPWEIEEKVQCYFNELPQRSQDDQDVIFIQVFFRRLNQIYLSRKIKQDSFAVFLEFVELKTLQYIMDLIEKTE